MMEAKAQVALESTETIYHPKRGGGGTILDIERFCLWYGRAQALFNNTLNIERGLVTALIGPSGCGKSTLLRSLNRMNDLIAGLSVSGRIVFEGKNIYDPDLDVIGLRKRMGMVFQKPNPFHMFIAENVTYPLKVDHVTDRRVLEETLERALKGSALWDEVKDRFKDNALGLSGGQQQRLCIARAIAADPDFLLMDEPCSALDPIDTLQIEELMHKLKKQFCIVIVTHNMQQAARVSAYTGVFWIDAATALEWGIVNHLLHEDELEAYTLDMARRMAAKAPLAMAEIKEQIRVISDYSPIPAQIFERIQDMRRQVYDSADYREGVAAFREKRQPMFRCE